MHKLPLSIDLNRVEILKAVNLANFKLGELKGMLFLLPNPQILLNAITLGEAKNSSEIENIITTYDELYREITAPNFNDTSAKEVLAYRSAMNHGINLLQDKGFISTNMLVEVQEKIEKNKGGIRKLPGTIIQNTATGEVLHTPPQSKQEIDNLLFDLEMYMNNEKEYDPLINMAIIHFQFESIHPFYDGNGRTGRILNILYLVLKNKINAPILYLSKYIIQNKEDYYRLLQEAQKREEAIIDFVLYMVKGVELMADFTIQFIKQINESIDHTSFMLIEKLPKVYSEELVHLLYYEFYTKNAYLKEGLHVSRNTASKYLKALEKEGFLVSEKVGKEVIYKNVVLYELMEKW